MPDRDHSALRARLQERKQELLARLERITANVRRGYEADSKERAQQLEDTEVVDALGNEARAEIARIAATVQRMEAGEFGTCVECGAVIEQGRLEAYPYADECIECAEFDERHRNRHN